MERQYDIAIIGGGIVGCAVLFELTRHGFSTILLEKNENIMSEASAGNSGMLHTGFDAPPNSLELHCIKECQKIIFNVLNKFHIPHKVCGTALVAWTPDELKKLPDLRNYIAATGIEDVHELTPSELYQKEMFLRKAACGSLFVPGEAVVDSGLLGLAYAHHAKRQGAKIVTNCEVFGFNDHTLSTSCGEVRAAVTVNCAGLYGDLINSLAHLNTFRIQPRCGQYCVFGKRPSHTVNAIIFPMPTQQSKGVALFKTVYNNVIMGPTAEDVSQRVCPAFDPVVHRSLAQRARWTVPELDRFAPVGHYMGVRPATQFKDYQIKAYPDIGWLTVGGIRSTGVSASLGIGQFVTELVESEFRVDPERGRATSVEELHWSPTADRTSVLFDNCQYKILHPIGLFGQLDTDSNL